jgi:hypothetical protein
LQGKFLICGDVHGDLGSLDARVTTLHASAHGPFDAVFVVGGLFSAAAGSAEAASAPLGEWQPARCGAPLATTAVGGTACCAVVVCRERAVRRVGRPVLWLVQWHRKGGVWRGAGSGGWEWVGGIPHALRSRAACVNSCRLVCPSPFAVSCAPPPPSLHRQLPMPPSSYARAHTHIHTHTHAHVHKNANTHIRTRAQPLQCAGVCVCTFMLCTRALSGAE